MSGCVGRFSGRYSKCSIFGATQNATRALSGHLMIGRSVIGAYSNRPGASVMLSAPLGGLRFEPVDDLGSGRLPHPGMGADVAEYFVEMPDAPRLAHDPRMQMQHHQTSRIGAVRIEPIEPLAPE